MNRQPTRNTTHPDIEEYVSSIEKSNLPPLLSPIRIATMLDLDRRRIYDLVASGELAGVRHGTRGLRIFRQSLLNWLRRGGSAGGTHRENWH